MFYNRQKIIYLIVAVLLIGGGVLSWAIFSGKIKIGADENAPNQANRNLDAKYAPGEFLVKLKPGTVAAKDSFGLPVEKFEPISKSEISTKTNSIVNQYYKLVITIPKNEASITTQSADETKTDATNNTYHQRILEALSQNPSIEKVSLNYKRTGQWIPNDYYYANDNSLGTSYPAMWGLKNVGMKQAWELSKGKDVPVAVIDTGVDISHEDLAENILKDASGKPVVYNAVDNSEIVIDEIGHGTHVAGTIAAVGNNGIGVVGIAPKAKIMPIKVFRGEYAYDEDIIRGIQFAANHGAKVGNMSLGGFGQNPLLDETLESVSSEMIIVVAAGNYWADAMLFYPASSSSVITVGALDSNNQLAYFSNFGPKIDVVAPGVDIVSTTPANMGDPALFGGKYARFSGTSMATPHVSGSAALEIAKHPDWSQNQIKDAIIHSAKDLGGKGFDDTFGYGEINPLTALSLQSPYQLPVAQINPLPETTRTEFQINGSAEGNNFANYKLEYRKTNFLDFSPKEYYSATENSQPVSNQSLGKISVNSPGISDSSYYIRLITNTASGLSNRVFKKIDIMEHQLPGFPIQADYLSPYSPVVSKLNGQDQVIVSTTLGSVSTYKTNGELIWTKQLEPSQIISTTPIVSDLNTDGSKEIVIRVHRWGTTQTEIIAFDASGNQLWQYSPVNSYDSLGSDSWGKTPPVTMSADYNNDGKNDILIGYEFNKIIDVYKNHFGYKIAIINNTGQLIAEKEIFSSEKDMGDVDCRAATGNLNENPANEIVFSCRINTYHFEGTVPVIKRQFLLRAYDNQFNKLWEKVWDKFANPSPVILVDINGDQKAEILTTFFSNEIPEYYAQGSYLHIFDGQGKQLKKITLGKRTTWWGPPGPNMQYYPPVFQIIPGVINNKIVLTYDSSAIYGTAPNDKLIRRIDQVGITDASLNWSFQGYPWLYQSPLFADIDNDQKPEVLALDPDRGLKIIKDGKVSSARDISGYTHTGALADVNGNQKIDYITQALDNYILSVPGIYASEFKGSAPFSSVSWPMAMHDPRQTNNMLESTD